MLAARLEADSSSTLRRLVRFIRLKSPRVCQRNSRLKLATADSSSTLEPISTLASLSCLFKISLPRQGTSATSALCLYKRRMARLHEKVRIATEDQVRAIVLLCKSFYQGVEELLRTIRV